MYRSLIESTGFGTRRILDAFAAAHVPATELIAVGGLAERSPLLLQVYPDITDRLDWEIELVCVMGAPLQPGAAAIGSVLGYTIGCDTSARDAGMPAGPGIPAGVV